MCLMAICSGADLKIYIPYKQNHRRIDLKAKASIEEEFGLALKVWTVLWYRPGGPDMITEIVPPEHGVRDW